ncbi:MAG TPA: phosphotransferase [Dehalococcoidia bacterium]
MCEGRHAGGGARAKLVRHLSGNVGSIEVIEGPDRYLAGLDTYVYGIRFAGDVPPEWIAPLVLRVYPSPEQVQKAEREAAIQRFVADQGFPAPRPLLVDTSCQPFGLPFMLMERVPGPSAVDRFKNPLKIRSTVRAMAAMQARLHLLPIDGCPLPYESPLVDRLLAPSRDLIQRFRPPGLDSPLAWLEEHASIVRNEDVALVHNDFHPLNIQAEGDRMSLLDWPDAAIGDRHSDVARTLAVFWLAAPLEKSLAGRTVLGALRRYIVPLYLREYRRHLPLDDRRLRYWGALHAFAEWVLISVMQHAGEAAIGARPGVLAEIPQAVVTSLPEYFRRRVSLLETA